MKVLRNTLLVLCLSLLLASCAQEAGTTTVKLVLNSGSKTIIADSTEITHYIVTGTDPGSKTHTWKPQESYITLDGIETGQWTFNATGYNANDLPIAKGSKSVVVTSQTRSITINLADSVETGSMNISFSWDASKVTSPSLYVTKRGPDLSSDPEDITSELSGDINSGSVTYTKSNLQQGSYIVNAVLKDGSVQIGGATETVIVVGGATAQGNIPIGYGGSYSPSGATIYITNTVGNAISGSFDSSMSTTLESGEKKTTQVKFLLDKTVDGTSCSIEWYIDGTKISENCDSTFTYVEGTDSQTGKAYSRYESYMTLTPEIGQHSVDVVVYNNKQCSAGSARWSYTGIPACSTGGIQNIAALENGDNGIITGQDVLIGALPDGKFAVLSKTKGRISICKVSGNTLVMESSCEYTWLKNADGLYSSPLSRVFIASASESGTKTITTFLYTATDSGSTVDKVPAEKGGIDGLNYIRFFEIEIFDIKHVEFTPYSNGVKVFITLCDEDSTFLGLVIKGDTIENDHILSFQYPGYMDAPDADFYTDSTYTTGRRLTVGLSNNAIQVIDYTPETSALSEDRYTINCTSSMNKANFIDLKTVVAGDNSSMHVFTESSNVWTQQESSLDFGVSQMELSSSYIYILDRSETLHAVSYSDNTLTEINSIGFENASSIALSGNSIVVASSDGKLYLCNIKQSV